MKISRSKRLSGWSFFILVCLGILAGFALTSDFYSSIAMAADSVETVIASGSAAAKELPVVYMTTKIDPEGLAAIYKAMERKLPGKVGVKISTGEPGGHNFLAPALIKDLVHSLKGVIVECNTAYGGKRSTTEMHKKAAKDHGFTAIATVDILDEEGSVSLPVTGGKNIKENFVGSHFLNYDSFLVLSHFKGHQMGGFGGALKNISIGFASASGKMWIHTAGGTKKTGDISPAFKTDQNAFLESMAEAAGSVMKKMGDKIAYINVMNKLSIDCDCNGNPAPPEMADIGILASLDPVALDQACVDLVYASPDKKKSASLCKRMEMKNAVHILEHAEFMGLGSRKYKLVKVNE